MTENNSSAEKGHFSKKSVVVTQGMRKAELDTLARTVSLLLEIAALLKIIRLLFDCVFIYVFICLFIYLFIYLSCYLFI